jgi:hypothetical protein
MTGKLDRDVSEYGPMTADSQGMLTQLSNTPLLRGTAGFFDRASIDQAVHRSLLMLALVPDEALLQLEM